MGPRRSKRLKTTTKPEYAEPPDLSDLSGGDGGDDDDDDDDDDNELDISPDLLALLQQALAGSLRGMDGDIIEIELVGTPPSRKRPRKKKRPDNRLLEPPPIHPTNLATLIDLCKQCKHKDFIDCFNLHDVLEPLQELDAMVGLQTVKQSMVEFILLTLQSESIRVPDMRHMIIAGPPGCGKTTVSTIIAKIMSRLHLCDTEKIVYGTQANLIGAFLGQTAPKTEALIRSAFGGVLVIDEASSLADGRAAENFDSFSKSCIDTLNRMLSEHGDKFVCIVAGYKEEIYRDILSVNPGMDRRFATRFEIEPYAPAEILEIIHRHVLRRGAVLEGTIPLQWVQDHLGMFKNAGGDCLAVVDTILMEHAKRTFGTVQKNTLSQEDVERGLAVVQQRHAIRQPTLPTCLQYMYT